MALASRIIAGHPQSECALRSFGDNRLDHGWVHLPPMRSRAIGRRAVRSCTARCRAGHYGLCDVRERAELVSGKLGFRSADACGTEVEVLVPRACAYRRAYAFDGADAAAGFAVAAQ
jgi:hypothetical protein